MAIYVYNTKQQELNSKKLAELFSFSSNDFCGLISNIQNPIKIDESTNSWSWEEPLPNKVVDFMGGGVDISYDVPTSSFTFTSVEGYNGSIWGIDVTIPDANSSPITNVYNSASIVQVPCRNIEVKDLYITVENPFGNPAQKQYYVYDNGDYELSSDTEVDNEKVYYYKLADEVYSVTSANFGDGVSISFDYYGNTVWINKGKGRFFIPFCGRISDGNTPESFTYFSILFNRDKAGYESFLSVRTYYNLLQELGNQFVFRSGGPKKGDVGKLNITDNRISNQYDSTDTVIIQNPSFEITEFNNDNIDRVLVLNEDSGRVYKTNKDYIIPIKHGGTSAKEKDKARSNLGFYYGDQDPNLIPNFIPTKTDGTADINAVYFKIL